MDSRLLQLVDSSFPSGSFAHSQGLEALWQLGMVPDEAAVRLRVEELTWHVAHGSLPFVSAAWAADAPGRAAVDRACDVFLCGHVANRASRAQGRAMAVAAEAMMGAPVGGDLPFQHLAVVFGATAAAAGSSRLDARAGFLFSALRGAVSSLVRLGLVGPLKGQALLFALAGTVEAAEVETRGLGCDDASSVAWLVEAAQQAQDRLYSRLFQS